MIIAERHAVFAHDVTFDRLPPDVVASVRPRRPTHAATALSRLL